MFRFPLLEQSLSNGLGELVELQGGKGEGAKEGGRWNRSERLIREREGGGKERVRGYGPVYQLSSFPGVCWAGLLFLKGEGKGGDGGWREGREGAKGGEGQLREIVVALRVISSRKKRQVRKSRESHDR